VLEAAPRKNQKGNYTLLKTVLPPINRAGWPFIGLFAVVSVVAAYIWEPLGWAGGVLTLWCAYFFRDPDRVTPTRGGLVISPADGVVQSVGRAEAPVELKMEGLALNRISIFMNVFDVHVNRMPAAGRIEEVQYRPGKFFNASLDKASQHNERQSIRLLTEAGEAIGVVQIAGLIARRIKCDVRTGQDLRAGERFGLIRFGSRVDVYLPESVPALVVPGQRAIAGETVIADFRAQEEPRAGEVR
jgi:phosphatidylserine decarboxylase|tara:strand:+ start:1643 stop:2374 length:732 start_codon:yes stop_codon:yes gene_type:complete